MFLTFRRRLQLARSCSCKAERVSCCRYSRTTCTDRILDIVAVACDLLSPTSGGVGYSVTSVRDARGLEAYSRSTDIFAYLVYTIANASYETSSIVAGAANVALDCSIEPVAVLGRLITSFAGRGLSALWLLVLLLLVAARCCHLVQAVFLGPMLCHQERSSLK